MSVMILYFVCDYIRVSFAGNGTVNAAREYRKRLRIFSVFIQEKYGFTVKVIIKKLTTNQSINPYV
jgi:hypothetical protein